MARPWTRRRKLATAGALTSSTALALGGAGVGWLAAYFARQVVTPIMEKPDDLQLLEVTQDRVVLDVTPDTVVPGRYGVWVRGGGNVRIGDVLDRTPTTVTRALEEPPPDGLVPGPARFNQYYVAGDPTQAWGLPHEEISLLSPVGDLPCWLVPPDETGADRRGTNSTGTWAVLIHGRGATREECLRGVPVLHRLGITTLVPAYRNDRDAPVDLRGRYHFGGTEWRDIEAAVLWAVDHGASRVVLMGWSMGGAIALQLLARSWLAPHVQAVVLDSPVIDWADVLDHTARLNRVPVGVGRASQGMTRHPLLRRVIGLSEPVDLRSLDWVRRADELSVPMLLIHSTADDVVPVGPSRALGQARPDLVTYVEWDTARHTKEWNVDPERWEREVTQFLDRVLG